MNILKGRLNKREMKKFLGVELKEVDKSLEFYQKKGYASYEKIGSKYHFIMFCKPVKQIELNDISN